MGNLIPQVDSNQKIRELTDEATTNTTYDNYAIPSAELL